MRTDTFTGREKITKIIVSVFGFVLRFLVLVFSGKRFIMTNFSIYTILTDIHIISIFFEIPFYLFV